MSGSFQIQYKTAGFAVSLKEAGLESDGWEIGGYASTFGGPPDLVGDIIEKGAYRETLKERPVIPVLYQHDQLEPIGHTLFMAEDDYGLLFKARLDPTRRGNDARILTSSGTLQGVSIGYDADYEPGRAPGVKRVLKRIALFEISCVTWAANPKARLTASGPAKAALLDSLLVAEVDALQRRGLAIPQRKLSAYCEAQKRQMERLEHQGRTAHELLYAINFELQELGRES